jgi:hypothetical protein
MDKIKLISGYKRAVDDGLEYNLIQIQKPYVFLDQERLKSFNKAIDWQKDMIKKLEEQILELTKK